MNFWLHPRQAVRRTLCGPSSSLTSSTSFTSFTSLSLVFRTNNSQYGRSGSCWNGAFRPCRNKTLESCRNVPALPNRARAARSGSWVQSGPPILALSSLAATLVDLPISVANKGFMARLKPLDATLTKNPGEGASAPVWSYQHTGTLPRLIFFASHSYENYRRVGVFFPFWFTLGAAEWTSTSAHASPTPPLPAAPFSIFTFPFSVCLDSQPLPSGSFTSHQPAPTLSGSRITTHFFNASSTGAEMISRTRSRSAGTSAFVSPFVSIVSCRCTVIVAGQSIQ